MGDPERIPSSSRFKSVLQTDVPKGRDGKHKQIITELLGDIELLSPGSALKIPLSELPDTKENIRSALSRTAAPSTTSTKEQALIARRHSGKTTHQSPLPKAAKLGPGRSSNRRA